MNSSEYSFFFCLFVEWWQSLISGSTQNTTNLLKLCLYRKSIVFGELYTVCEQQGLNITERIGAQNVNGTKTANKQTQKSCKSPSQSTYQSVNLEPKSAVSITHDLLFTLLMCRII
jgi:hypothetical protein